MDRHIQIAALAVLALAGTGSVSDPGPRGGTPPTWQSVAYHGIQVSVPADWPVIDLARRPDQCARLDRHAVYLGAQGPAAACPAAALGHTEAVRIQPLDAGSPDARTATVPTTIGGHAARTTADPDVDGALVDVLPDAGVQVTISYREDRPLATRIQSSIDDVTWPGSGPAASPAAPAVTPAAISQGVFTGRGFDPCAAPSASTMNAWLGSPFRAIGVYLGGINRACAQPNLTASWLTAVHGQGWSVFPLYVGRQAPCTTASNVAVIDAGSAAAEGTQAADDAAARAAALGLPAGTPLVFDMEQYGACASTVLAFLDAYGRECHAKGFRAGVYESFSNVGDLSSGGSISQIDVIDYAAWDGVATTDSSYMPSDAWTDHQRIHQYLGGHDETWGGVTINIDSDQLDVDLGGVRSATAARSFVDGDEQEVFARDTAGDLRHWYWSPDSGGVRQQDWGGTLAGDPVGFVYGDEQHVFARDTAGHLHHWYWSPGGGVQQQDWAGSVAGDPTGFVYRDEQHVFARDTAGHLHHWYWSPGGTVQQQDWGGTLAGDPVAFVDGDEQHVFARDAAGHLHHWYWAPGGSVQQQDWAGSVAGDPTAFVYGNQQHVFARDTAGHLHHWVWAPGGSVQQQDWAGSVAGDPVGFVYGNQQHVFARDTAGHLHHWVWAPGGSVQQQDWGGSAAGDPTAFVYGDEQHVFARDAAGHLHHWYWSPDSGGVQQQDWSGNPA